jgi:hypothetical protein
LFCKRMFCFNFSQIENFFKIIKNQMLAYPNLSNNLPLPNDSSPTVVKTRKIIFPTIFFFLKNGFFSKLVSAKIVYFFFSTFFCQNSISHDFKFLGGFLVTRELITPNFQIIIFSFFLKTSHVITFELKRMKMESKNVYKDILFIFFSSDKKNKKYIFMKIFQLHFHCF